MNQDDINNLNNKRNHGNNANNTNLNNYDGLNITHNGEHNELITNSLLNQNNINFNEKNEIFKESLKNSQSKGYNPNYNGNTINTKHKRNNKKNLDENATNTTIANNYIVESDIQKEVKPKKIISIIGIILIIIGTFLIIFRSLVFRNYLDIIDYNKTKGTLIDYYECKCENNLCLEGTNCKGVYLYTVDNQEYVGYPISYKRIKDFIPNNVTVYYNPSNPSENIIIYIPYVDYIIGIFFIIIGCNIKKKKD